MGAKDNMFSTLCVNSAQSVGNFATAVLVHKGNRISERQEEPQAGLHGAHAGVNRYPVFGPSAPSFENRRCITQPATSHPCVLHVIGRNKQDLVAP